MAKIISQIKQAEFLFNEEFKLLWKDKPKSSDNLANLSKFVGIYTSGFPLEPVPAGSKRGDCGNEDLIDGLGET